jgi:hypothetical protein
MNAAQLDEPHHDRAWWRQEAVRTRTDWSSLLRQRIRVLWWIRAGRPPLSKWAAEQERQ